MYSKIKITGTIKVETGLHIGSGGEISMIGAVDSPLVRDPLTKLPIIPGSSIKGKMRFLLNKYLGIIPNQKTANEDHCQVKRLFGSSEPNNILISRLQVSDAFLSNETIKEFEDNEMNVVEIKYENTIDRLTAVATPRQIERITRGSKFNFEFIYNVENEEEVYEDFSNIKQSFKLVENDYLGGGGSRGNGRVKFEIKKIETVIGEFDSGNLMEM